MSGIKKGIVMKAGLLMTLAVLLMIAGCAKKQAPPPPPSQSAPDAGDKAVMPNGGPPAKK